MLAVAAPASADDTTLMDTAGSDLHTADGDLSTALNDLGTNATPFEKTGIDQAIALQHLSHLGDQQLLSTEDALIAHSNPIEASVVQLLSNVFDDAIYQEAVNSLNADQALEAAVAATASAANDPSVLADTAAAAPAPVDNIGPLPQGVVNAGVAALTDVAATHFAESFLSALPPLFSIPLLF
ncbi:hypothetical protein [Mycobacterium botniense]|uniref:Uncharacterized protein n=1 Tax=Mycobacterium botniense TaxID=84962 RepID=A0A7I9Y363_9MYCO|nr:hypothetical protein [Mycobacterium botniense]GFG76491.1 hypothetical protein MBOT_38560 [Mycobacterium botniense]